MSKPLGDDEVTPTIDVDVAPPTRRWYAHKPGEGFTIIEGPANEPPVCEPCGKNTKPVEDPVFPGTQECDGCGTTFTPTDSKV